MITNIKKYMGTIIISLICLFVGIAIGSPTTSHTTIELNEEYEKINGDLSGKDLEVKTLNENINKAANKIEELKKSVKQ